MTESSKLLEPFITHKFCTSYKSSVIIFSVVFSVPNIQESRKKKEHGTSRNTFFRGQARVVYECDCGTLQNNTSPPVINNDLLKIKLTAVCEEWHVQHLR